MVGLFQYRHAQASGGVASQPQPSPASSRQPPVASRRKGEAAGEIKAPRNGPARRRDGARAEPAPASTGACASSGGGVGHAVSRSGAARGGQAVTRTTSGKSPFRSPSFPVPYPLRVLRVAFVSAIASGAVGCGEFSGFMSPMLPIGG